MAKEGGDEVEKTSTKLLGFLDAKVDRNAFGRQRESFERTLQINGYDDPYPGVFIRGPAIEKTWGDCIIRSQIDGITVMVQQGNVIGTAFHPELSNDLRIHKEIIEMVL